MRLDGVISDYRIALLRKRMLVFLLEVEAHAASRKVCTLLSAKFVASDAIFFPELQTRHLNANERRLDENPRGNFILAPESPF